MMTDRELMQQWLQPGAIVPVDTKTVRILLDALRERLAQPIELHKANQELLKALSDIAYGLESARIWGGMDWTYNPLHPFKYLPLRDKARAAIAKATGEQT